MKLEDLKDMQRRERRSCRANLRLYPSQLKFINDHGLSITKIMDTALDELGHKRPDPSEIDKIAEMIKQDPKGIGVSLARARTVKSRGKGRGEKGNVRVQKKRARAKPKTSVRRGRR
ncbi:hypothetical protein HN419_04665 [Candidatus Woesearchaeota archaeon]|jgi:hypothetical protein|nr:hypothetical protein [Candidatus Woesearchaeota archaeon]MBT3537831.1 hypothetical protein [Candidatus Woesearchaeota archaeon]MBT4697962.1 hypothetical protein [Candidatus Woesearchaeota archaeon]MBT7105500.1 hypothetical protein [Candidatus Woesearchaeota archaeon]MBT7931690.1 hypothetical protein [Candidatus Woesearchaeota archaeon]